MDNKKTKDSGIEWIGEIPEDWGLIRLKDIFTNKKNIVGANVEQYERLALTLNGVIKRPKNDLDGLQPKVFDGYQIIQKNDLVFKMIDLQNVSTSRVGLSPYEGLVSPAYLRFSPKNSNVQTKFIYYYFMSMYYNCVFNNLGGDGVRSSLNAFEMGQFKVPYPQVSTQHQIADFLDKKCSQIDELIANNQSQIDKLKEYKQSVITQAVTKGLDPDVETKDSGIDWIGQIPKNWEVVQIKNLINVRNEKYSGGNYSYIALENIIGFECKYKQTESTYDITQTNIAIKGDVIFGKLRPYLAKVYKITENSCVSTEFAVFYSYKVNMEYFKWYLLSYGFLDTVNASTYGTKMPRANIDFIKNLPFLFHNEQHQIADYLDKKCSQIDSLIEIKQQKIEKLQEYKKSLIYEYVTGKKEVG